MGHHGSYSGDGTVQCSWCHTNTPISVGQANVSCHGCGHQVSPGFQMRDGGPIERHRFRPLTMRDGSIACADCYAWKDHEVHQTSQVDTL